MCFYFLDGNNTETDRWIEYKLIFIKSLISLDKMTRVFYFIYLFSLFKSIKWESYLLSLYEISTKYIYGIYILAGINFHVFRVFQSFSRKFLPLEILNPQNAKVFSKLIKLVKKKIIKTGQFSKIMIYFYLKRRLLE